MSGGHLKVPETGMNICTASTAMSFCSRFSWGALYQVWPLVETKHDIARKQVSTRSIFHRIMNLLIWLLNFASRVVFFFWSFVLSIFLDRVDIVEMIHQRYITAFYADFLELVPHPKALLQCLDWRRKIVQKAAVGSDEWRSWYV